MQDYSQEDIDVSVKELRYIWETEIEKWALIRPPDGSDAYSVYNKEEHGLMIVESNTLARIMANHMLAAGVDILDDLPMKGENASDINDD